MVSFVGSSANGANLSTFNLTWPAVQAGDTAFVWHTLDAARTPTTPSGFTLLSNDAGGAGSTETEFSFKICTGAETGNLAITISGANERHAACLVVYRGCHPTTPVDTFASFNESTAGTTHASPTVTTGFPNCVALVAVGERVSSGTTNWTAPATYTEQADSLATGSGASGVSVAAADNGILPGLPAGTLIAPGVWTSGNLISTKNVITWTVSVRPTAPITAHDLRHSLNLQAVNRASTY